ncbi:LysM peptidoglycan-binding domain-containing protein [Pseudothermotoga thermarum]|uniref:Peptidase M23 n=1 Tax=Pseudothermotoga thermarum DSM 5069 TaxID=688269 RepID=F7YYI4_9THEM|nr:M23 family metallopeptidase [Pseudothermotoga thermarum]AEH51013.1 Peptidase M23 [Pseudothermotoga thermarum DSM 5069]
MQRLFTIFFILFSLICFGGYITITYTVQPGDTLIDIARKFKVSPSTILDWNNLSNATKLKVGQQLIIPQPEGYLYTVVKGDNLYTIAKRFFTTVSDIMIANNLTSDTIRVGQRLFIPASSIGKAFNREKGYIWPVFGTLSSPFGYRIHPITKKYSFHSGIDISAPEGTPVFASTSGVVTFAGENGGYGLMVEIKSGNVVTRYAHLSKITVYVGQNVSQGTLIGRVGSTGLTTGPHLHFEIVVAGNATNPLAYLPSSNNIYVLKETAGAVGGE